jgi:hypothetical protein
VLATSARTAARACVVGVAAQFFRGRAEPADILCSPYATEWLDLLTDSSK